MQDLEALKAEYQQAITDLHERQEELERQARGLRGQAYFRMRKRIACLYEEEGELAYALRALVRSMGGKPIMLLKPCARCGRAIPYGKPYCPACAVLVAENAKQRRRENNRRYDKSRDPKLVAFYHSKEWRALSRATLQRAGYRCEYCKREIATEVDHAVPLEEDWSLRFDPANLKATCHGCHDKKHGRFTPGGR